MDIYVMILRGVNVGANRKVPMAQLKAICEGFGLKHVVSYIQSGNIIFNSNNVKGLQQKLGRAIEQEFGFAVPVIIRSREAFNEVVTGNPFLNENGLDIARMHVTFLENQPDEALIAKIDTFSFTPDRLVINGQTVYLYIPESYGNTKLSNAFFESRLKVKATTRNWKTVSKLAEMMNA